MAFSSSGIRSALKQIIAKTKNGWYLVLWWWSFEIRNQRKKRIQAYVVNSFLWHFLFGWASWQSCTTLLGNSNNDLMSAQDFEQQNPQSDRLRAAEVLSPKDLPSPETSSLVRRIFLHQKNLPSPEEASFIREIFLRHENLSSSAESSVARRIIFR